MVSENVRCFLPGESSDKREIICHKSNKYVNKIVFWLPNKTLIYYNCMYCQKVTGVKHGSGSWPMTFFWYYKSTPKLNNINDYVRHNGV
jgi:hypothetical protein